MLCTIQYAGKIRGLLQHDIIALLCTIYCMLGIFEATVNTYTKPLWVKDINKKKKRKKNVHKHHRSERQSVTHIYTLASMILTPIYT